MASKLVPWAAEDGGIKYGEDNPIEKVPELTPEEKHSIKLRTEAMDKLLQAQGMAKYKIEIWFSKDRSIHKPCPGLVQFFESAAKLHGGGDTKVYLCPGKELKLSDCEAVIPFANNGYGHLLCPACGTVWQGEKVTGEILYNLSLRDWAIVILKHFVRLGHNADIYVKLSKNDIRAMSLLEQQRQHNGEKLSLARDQRPKYIYPLKNIIKDTAAGADLLGRIYAFLTA